MSVLCRYCGKRVASVASLAGHYRRKHPERITARPALRTAYPASSVARSRQPSGIAPHTAIKELSDAAYIARLAETKNSERSPMTGKPTQPNTGKPTSTGWWWPWALLVAVCFFFALSPDSDGSGHTDSSLVSSYQPEGNSR